MAYLGKNQNTKQHAITLSPPFLAEKLTQNLLYVTESVGGGGGLSMISTVYGKFPIPLICMPTTPHDASLEAYE